MNELVYLKKNEMYTDSLKVAEIFQRRHDDVVRSVEKLIERNEEASKDIRTFSDISKQFIKTRYRVSITSRFIRTAKSGWKRSRHGQR